MAKKKTKATKKAGKRKSSRPKAAPRKAGAKKKTGARKKRPVAATKKRPAAKRAPAAKVQLRTLAELLSTDEPAWPLVRSWIDAATNPVEVLPAKDPDRDFALLNTQVTVRSPLGALIHESGGLLIDHGWLRVLGSGHPKLPRTVPDWTLACGSFEPGTQPTFVLVGDDAVGGFFALDGGALGPGNGDVFYFAPDTCTWEPLDIGYGAWLDWCLVGDLASFYEELRWPGWEEEVRPLGGDQALAIYPPLWAQGPPLGERHRAPVPMSEMWSIQTQVYGPGLKDLPDGAQVTIKVTD